MTTLNCALEANWVGLIWPHLPNLPPPVTAKQRVVIIRADQPEKAIDGYGGNESGTSLRVLAKQLYGTPAY